MTRSKVPPYQDLLLPTLEAIEELGGSGSINEIVEAVQRRESFTEGQQAVLHKDGPETEIRYRQAWARTYLKGMGLLDNSRRGVWSLTEAGKKLLSDPALERGDKERRVMQLRAEYIAANRDRRRDASSRVNAVQDEGIAGEGVTWQEELLDVLMSMEPAAFERLAQRLLRLVELAVVHQFGQDRRSPGSEQQRPTRGEGPQVGDVKDLLPAQ